MALLPTLFDRVRQEKPEKLKLAARRERRHARCNDAADRRYYVLDVAHDIKRTDLNVFINQGKTLVDVIENTKDLKLRMSGWHIDGEIVRIYNYWELVDGPQSLIRAELKLPDNPVFVRFDRYMLSETKDLVTPMSMKFGLPITQADRNTGTRFVYARITYKVNPRDWAELLARFEGTLKAFGIENGWRLGDTYIGLTGDASTITQTWAVPEAAAHLVAQRLASTSWAPLLAKPIVCQILEPTPSCPLLGRKPAYDRTIPQEPVKARVARAGKFPLRNIKVPVEVVLNPKDKERSSSDA